MSRDEIKPSLMRSRAAEPPALPPVVPFDSGTPAPTAPQPQQQLLPLPEFEWPSQVNESAMFEPAVLVEGMLHQGNKLVIGGGSKSYKTWCLTDLAISVSAGVPWIGLPCVQGVVLYINFEIQPVFFHKRIGAICRAKGIPKPQNLAIWNLRGQCYDLRQLLPVTRQRLEALKAQGTPVSLIILDPIYKSLGGRDENSAGDIGQLLLEIESLAEQTGAAVAFGAHFSKGNQSGKEAIDRISGSGVFARDPDSILTFTRHEEDESFTVDVTLRNFPRIDSFVVSWDFPLLKVNNTLDPEAIKKPGAPKKIDEGAILDLLPETGLMAGEWWEAADAAKLCSRGKFFEIKRNLEGADLVEKRGKRFFKSHGSDLF